MTAQRERIELLYCSGSVHRKLLPPATVLSLCPLCGLRTVFESCPSDRADKRTSYGWLRIRFEPPVSWSDIPLESDDMLADCIYTSTTVSVHCVTAGLERPHTASRDVPIRAFFRYLASNPYRNGCRYRDSIGK